MRNIAVDGPLSIRAIARVCWSSLCASVAASGATLVKNEDYWDKDNVAVQRVEFDDNPLEKRWVAVS